MKGKVVNEGCIGSRKKETLLENTVRYVMDGKIGKTDKMKWILTTCLKGIESQC